MPHQTVTTHGQHTLVLLVMAWIVAHHHAYACQTYKNHRATNLPHLFSFDIVSLSSSSPSSHVSEEDEKLSEKDVQNVVVAVGC